MCADVTVWMSWTVLIPDLSTPSGPNLLSENSICLVSGGWSENLSIVWTSDSVTVQNRREKGTPHTWLFCCTLCGPNSLSGSKQWTIEHPLINTNISPVTLAGDRGPPISVKTSPQEPVKLFSAKGFFHYSESTSVRDLQIPLTNSFLAPIRLGIWQSRQLPW